MTRLPFAVKRGSRTHRIQSEKRAVSTIIKGKQGETQSIFSVAPVESEIDYRQEYL